jgi:hypothetical protein
MKKTLITMAVIAFAFAFSFSFAFAKIPGPMPSSFNSAIVSNNVNTGASTGDNTTNASNGFFGKTVVATGDARAKSNTITAANTSIGGGSKGTNMAFVDNDIATGASTGDNTTNASSAGGGKTIVATGDASASSNTITLVNTSVSFGK